MIYSVFTGNRSTMCGRSGNSANLSCLYLFLSTSCVNGPSKIVFTVARENFTRNEASHLISKFERDWFFFWAGGGGGGGGGGEGWPRTREWPLYVANFPRPG